MAQTFWPEQQAIGKRIKPVHRQSADPWLTVVGITADVRQVDLVRTPRPAMYMPASQDRGPATLRDWISGRAAIRWRSRRRSAVRSGRSIRRCRSRACRRWIR
jgi:hypothetical protein